MTDTNANAGGNSAPLTKTARQQKIIDLITRQSVRSQIELAEALATMGITVTQATLSRDLAEVGAVKIRSTAGSMYAVPGEGGDRSLQQSTGTASMRSCPGFSRNSSSPRSRRTTRSCCAPRPGPHSISRLGDRPLLDGRDLRDPGRRRHGPRHRRRRSRGSGPGRDVPRIRGRRTRRWVRNPRSRWVDEPPRR